MDLHSQVELLFPGEKRSLIRMLVHALIDLGQITEIKCAWVQCVLPDVPLAPAGRGRACVTLDHIIATANGGTDDWRNGQLVHFTCNARKAHVFTLEMRQRIGEQTRLRWQDPKQRANILEKVGASLKREDVRERKRVAMKQHWSDPEKKAQHTASLLRGDAHRAARSHHVPTVCDVCGKIYKTPGAAKGHKTRKH